MPSENQQQKKCVTIKRRSARITAKKKRKRTAKKKAVTLSTHAKHLLAKIDAKRDMLATCAARGYLPEETVADRRYVVDAFARTIRETGRADKATLQQQAYRIIGAARKNPAPGTAPATNGKSRKGKQRALEQWEESRATAYSRVARSIFARNYYQELTGQPLPAHPNIRPLQIAPSGMQP